VKIGLHAVCVVANARRTFLWKWQAPIQEASKEGQRKEEALARLSAVRGRAACSSTGNEIGGGKKVVYNTMNPQGAWHRPDSN
jgi:hypothetical protein